MTSNKQSQSHSLLSDPLPRIYACFCDRIYTTYPGIYLHLKSKHSHLFYKYKNSKITRLFKKIKDEDGNYIYRLEQLSEHNSQVLKEDPSFLKQIKREYQVVQDSNYIYKHKKNKYLYQNPSLRRKRTSTFATLEFQGNNFGQQMQKGRFMTNPFPNIPMGMGYPQFTPLFQSYSPVFPEFMMTTKKVMQNYLQQFQTNQKLQAKKYLYNLMVYIDKNFEKIKDERMKNKIFLSYCCDFDPQFIAPLILSYLQLLQTKKNNVSQSQQGYSHDAEILCIKGFFQLLRSQWIGQSEMQQQSLQKQKKVSYKQKQKIQVLVEWQEQNQQYKLDLNQ